MGTPSKGWRWCESRLEADPKIDVLLADDAVGVFVGFRIHIDWTESGHRGFLLAGFSPNDYRIVTFLDFIFALGDRSVGSYASKTSQAIRSLMEGKPVSDVVEVPVAFIQSQRFPPHCERTSFRPNPPENPNADRNALFRLGTERPDVDRRRTLAFPRFIRRNVQSRPPAMVPPSTESSTSTMVTERRLTAGRTRPIGLVWPGGRVIGGGRELSGRSFPATVCT